MAEDNKILTDIPDQTLEEQLSLLGPPERGVVDTPLPLSKSRGPGRPAGSVNKKTLTLQKWLLALGYAHPAIQLAEIAARPAWELAEELKCTRLEAFQEQRKAASDLLPYFEGRMLPATADGDQPLPVFNMFLGTDQVTQNNLNAQNGGAIQIVAKTAETGHSAGDDDDKSHGEEVARGDIIEANQEDNGDAAAD